MSAFDNWFSRQHGPRELMSKKPDAELVDLMSRGDAARVEYEARKLWDNKRSSALYGWNVKDDDKKSYTEPVQQMRASHI